MLLLVFGNYLKTVVLVVEMKCYEMLKSIKSNDQELAQSEQNCVTEIGNNIKCSNRQIIKRTCTALSHAIKYY